MADANELGEAYVKIRPRANAPEFQRETEQQLGPATKQAGDSLGRTLGDALTVGAFAAFSTTVVRSAAEAEQAVGGTKAVFKDFSSEIDAFASNSAEKLGLTEQATRQFTSVLGSALKGYGFSVEEAAKTSQDLVVIGSDLTALFGGTVPDAVTALSAALRGEFDPLERYGISLTAAAVGAKAVSLGLADSTSNVDGHAKAVATLAIIQEQSVDAQGQFARETGTAAGQMAIATAKLGDARDELGSRFLPLVTKGAGIVSSLADAFGALPGPIQASVTAIVALIALSGPLGRFGDKVKGAVEDMRSGGDEALSFRQKLSTLAKTGVIVAGITAITGAIDEFKTATAKAQGDFSSSLPDVSDVQGYRDAVNAAIERQGALSDELNRFTDEGSDASEIPAQLGAAWNFFTSSITGNVSAVGALKAEYDGLTASLPAAKQKAEDLTVKVNDLGLAVGVSGVEAANFVKQFAGLDITQVPMQKLIDAFNAARQPGADLAQIAADLGVEVKTAGDEMQEAADKLEDLRAGLFGLVDAAHQYEDAQQGVADAERASERAQQAKVDALRNQQQAIQGIADAQDSYQDAQQATADAEQRRIESLESVEAATRSVEEAQRRLQEALNGPTESDDLDIEAAEIRLRQMRERLNDPDLSADERRLQQIQVRQAEIALAEQKAEIDGRVAEAEQGVVDAEARLLDAHQSAEAATRSVTEAREAEAGALRGIEAANYNAQKATDAIRDAEIRAEQASRDVEDAKWDQLKASEELAKKIGEEQVAFAGANQEVGKLVDYYRNLIALRPELESAIAPLLALLQSAAAPKPGTGQQGVGGIPGAPFQSGFSDNAVPGAPGGGAGGEYIPPGVYDGVYWPGGVVLPGQPGPGRNGGGGVRDVNINVYGAGVDEVAREVQRRVGHELAQAVGW